MSNINLFNFNKHAVRVITDNNSEPMFVAKDVALALGYVDHTNAIKQHCRGAVEYHAVHDARKQLRKTRVIREPDVYRMAIHSQLPSAESFNKLVFEEILPTIRKTGSYHADNSDFANTLEIQIAEVAARMLSMSDTDKIKMFATIYEEKGISTKFLPSYSNQTHKHLED